MTKHRKPPYRRVSSIRREELHKAGLGLYDLRDRLLDEAREACMGYPIPPFLEALGRLIYERGLPPSGFKTNKEKEDKTT
jgi:hypothetical protein